MATLPTKCKPSKVLGKDQARPLLANAHIRKVGDQFQLEACDSYRLAIIPIDSAEGELSEGLISPDALKAIEKTKGFGSGFQANGCIDVGEQSFKRPDSESHRIPNYPELMPQPPTPEETFQVTLNAKYLYELAQALGSERDTVTLTFNLGADPATYLKAISVTGTTEARGLIMPIRGPSERR